MKPEQNYFLLGSENPIRVRRAGVRKPPVIRRTSGNRSAEVDYYTTLLIEHLQEYFPGEMLLLKDLRARARIAYKESVRTNVPIADALANALRYLFFGFETSGFERLKSEIWMQGYYSQAKAEYLRTISIVTLLHGVALCVGLVELAKRKHIVQVGVEAFYQEVGLYGAEIMIQVG